MFGSKKEKAAKSVEVPEVPKSEFPKDHSSLNSTYHLYRVEARSKGKPIAIGKQILAGEWQPLDVVDGLPAGVGVPSHHRMAEIHGVDSGLYPYASAQALRWQSHAVAESLGKDWDLETRLVCHKVDFSKKVTAIGSIDPAEGETRYRA